MPATADAADVACPSSYTASLYLVQPVFLASKIYLEEMIAHKDSALDDRLQGLLNLIARQNLDILVNALRKMAVRWSGAAFPLSVRYHVPAELTVGSARAGRTVRRRESDWRRLARLRLRVDPRCGNAPIAERYVRLTRM